MTSISTSAYINKLDNVVNIYNNTYHGTVKMEPVDVKSSTYIGFGTENDNKSSESKVADLLRTPKYKKNVNVNTPNCSEEVFVIKKS